MKPMNIIPFTLEGDHGVSPGASLPQSLRNLVQILENNTIQHESGAILLRREMSHEGVIRIALMSDLVFNLKTKYVRVMQKDYDAMVLELHAFRAAAKAAANNALGDDNVANTYVKKV